MLAISLFSGVGGMDLGLERAGIPTILQVEIDPWCQRVLTRHWPDVRRIADVRDVSRGDLPDADLVHGGFPCTDVSNAGKRVGITGTNSGLFFELVRVLSALRPRWCLIENVPGLLSSNGRRDFGVVLARLGELGYGLAWRILDARFFGVPQRRRRVFIVGCRQPGGRVGAECAAEVLALREGGCGNPAPGRTTRQAVAYTLAASTRGSGDGHGNAWNSTYVTGPVTSRPAADRGDTNYLIAPVDPRNVTSQANRSRVAKGDPASTLHSGGQSIISHDVIAGSFGVRRLMPVECERLMGWPDDFTRWTADGREIADRIRYRMIGNGVVATVAEWIGRRLITVNDAL